MSRPVRHLVALSFAVLAACESSPGVNPPTPRAAGQFAVTIPAQPGSTSDHPFHAGDDFRIQSLYLAGELQAAGRIVAIRLQRAAPSAIAVTCPAVTVRLGHSTATSLNATFASNANASTLSAVTTSATLAIPAGEAGTWFDVPVAVPFDYDGVENLLVDVESPAACSGTVTIGTLNTGGSGRRLLSTAADSDPATPQHSVTSGGLDNLPPGVQLVLEGGDKRLVFDGGTAQNNFPMTQYAGGIRWQNLHLAAEVAGAGPITGLAFEAAGATTATFVYSLRLGHTSVSKLSPAPFDGFSSDWVQVASSVTVTVPGGTLPGAWVWIPMPHGTFTYNGRDNLVVEVRTFSGTVDCPFRTSTRDSRRHVANAGIPDPGFADSTVTHTAFRFAGGPAIVTKPHGTCPDAGQPFGNGHPGQIMSLYEGCRLGTTGTITAISLRLAGASLATTVPNYRVYMGTTAKGAYALADTYASSLDGATLVYSGPLSVPAGLAAGDWIDLPLQTPFAYDASRNLSLLLASDQASASNTAATVVGAGEWTSHAVGRSDNPQPLTSTPTWDSDGAVAVKLWFE